MKVSHSCPHCGCGKKSASHVMKHKCRMCGGSWLSSLGSFAKQAISHPMVQNLARSAVSHVANKYAPGLTSHVQNAMAHPLAQRAMSHPMAQHALGSLRKKVGLGRRTRPPTKHSLAVGHVMKQTGMGLAQASKYVKENGLAM